MDTLILYKCNLAAVDPSVSRETMLAYFKDKGKRKLKKKQNAESTLDESRYDTSKSADKTYENGSKHCGK